MPASAQIAGYTSGNIAEVEANTKALRTTLRDIDYGALGIYSLGGATGALTGFTAATEIFYLRWTHATNLALIRRITLSAGGTTLGTAGLFTMRAFIARSWSGIGSGGTAILPTGNQNKLRTSGMGTTLVNDARIALTGALTAGTKTNDTNPIGTVVGAAPATAGSVILAPYPIWDCRPGEHPIVLATNEGIVIDTTSPNALDVFTVGVRIEWAEIASY